MSEVTKTPEQMAEEFAVQCPPRFNSHYKAFLAGYQAAKDQLGDADKVVTADYVETASNDAKELITKFELQGDQDMLIKALVAAYCRGVDAVDGYLRNSLSAYRNSVKRLQWISVKEQLPQFCKTVVAYGPRIHCVISQLTQDDEGYSFVGPYMSVHPDEVTHWCELPELPKLPKED